jgi:hypothetical protein
MINQILTEQAETIRMRQGFAGDSKIVSQRRTETPPAAT